MVEKSNPEWVSKWLIAEGSRLSSPAQMLEHYCQKLREAGVLVDRSTLGAPLLHPIAQSSYVFWNKDSGAEERWFIYSPDTIEALRVSPIYAIYNEGRGTSLRLDNIEQRSIYPVGEDLFAEGYVHYQALPLRFSDGTYKVLTLATRSLEGFDEGDQQVIENTLPALALVFESYIARNTAKTLMETYVGKRAGLRVLDGEIARGDGNHINAVIWFSDLRGFTALAQNRTEDELLALLNDYFGKITDSVEKHSGEVLKFIGDAILAIFTYENNIGEAIANAEAAAKEVVNSTGAKHVYSFGIGLHPGSVFYGNVGGGNRLDFTVIGPSVNIASRIEGLCSVHNQPILVSAAFAEKSSIKWQSIGHHGLKGVDDPVEIFAIS